MLAVDAAGNFYPCTRFAAYSLRNKRPIIVGNVEDGINKNLLRPFLTLDRTTQSSQNALTVKWPVDVHGVKGRIMMQPILIQFISDQQPFAKCTRQE